MVTRSNKGQEAGWPLAWTSHREPKAQPFFKTPSHKVLPAGAAQALAACEVCFLDRQFQHTLLTFQTGRPNVSTASSWADPSGPLRLVCSCIRNFVSGLIGQHLVGPRPGPAHSPAKAPPTAPDLQDRVCQRWTESPGPGLGQ